MKVAIVAPVHIQPSEKWVSQLKKQKADVIIVDDSDGKVNLPFEMFGYEKQRELLGEELYKRFEVYHKSSACKNFGVWLAYERGYDYIIILDSDCIVPDDFVKKHLEQMKKKAWGWENPIKRTGKFPRGFPDYERDRSVALNMGLWNNVLDLNGADREEGEPTEPMADEFNVAQGVMPLSGMNVCIKRELAPAYTFLPNYDHVSLKFRRHDDIWGGYIAQLLILNMGERCSYGDPIVYHDTVVDAAADAKEEDAMNKMDKYFFILVDKMIGLRRDSYQKMFSDVVDMAWHLNTGFCFEPLIEALKFHRDLYARHLTD